MPKMMFETHSVDCVRTTIDRAIERVLLAVSRPRLADILSGWYCPSPAVRKLMSSPADLSNAAFEGDLELVHNLLNGGAEIDAIGEVWNPLHAAIENEQIAIVELLIRRGANLEAIACDMTPLEHAVDISIDGTIQSGGKPGDEPLEIIQLLLEHSAKRESAIALAKKYQSERVISALSRQSE